MNEENFIRILFRMKMIQKFDGHVFVTISDALTHANERYSQRESSVSKELQVTAKTDR